MHRREFLIAASTWTAIAATSDCLVADRPTASDMWTLAILPDTQYYSESYPQHFEAQTRWIADHAKAHNIRYVLHEGDITNDNSPRQWANARRALALLDGVVPYALCVGNHDCGPGGDGAVRETWFRAAEFFGPESDYSRQKSVGGFFESERTENSFHTFDAGGRRWLVLALEWAPRDGVVAWANQMVALHPEHLVMLVTHAYLYNDDTRYDWAAKREGQHWNPHAYGIATQPNETVNDGQQLWDKLVSRHKTFRFAFNGHVLEDGTGRLTSHGIHGNTVHQLLANYQFKTEGGQGDLRLLTFLADRKTVRIRTYSPVLDRYDEAADQEFLLTYDT